jgi:hypothetical protein
MAKIFSNSSNLAECTTGPFERPVASSARPLKWYLDTKPRGYKPLMVRVTHDLINHGSLTFYFLHNETAADLSGPHTFTRAELDDQTKSYSSLPASAIKVDLETSSQKNCGFLFLKEEFIKSIKPIPVQTGTTVDLMVESVGDGKYPKGASASPLVSALNRIMDLADKETILRPVELEAIRKLLRLMGEP